MKSCPSCQTVYADPVEVCPHDQSETIGLSQLEREAAEREAEDDLVGELIGGYRVDERIGRGGMGAVYRARHPELDKQVAVKVLLGSLQGRDDVRRRFLDEARMIAALDSPHVVGVHDLATLPDGRGYIVMEYLEGESFGNMLKHRGSLPPGEAVAVCLQALSGLGQAHDRGIVHRDMKPANLFIACEPDGTASVRVLDFGIAKLEQDDDDAGITQSGAMLGTPGYMAPEQSAGRSRDVDARADIYSMGVILYGAIAGKLPFTSNDVLYLLMQHRNQEPPLLPEVDGLTDSLRAAVAKALSKQPEDRFESAEAMAQALTEAIGGADAIPPIPLPRVEEISAPESRHTPWSRPSETAATRSVRKTPGRNRVDAKPVPEPVTTSSGRNPWPFIAMAFALIAAAALVMLWLRDGGDPERESAREPARSAATAPRNADARAAPTDAAVLARGVSDAAPEPNPGTTPPRRTKKRTRRGAATPNQPKIVGPRSCRVMLTDETGKLHKVSRTRIVFSDLRNHIVFGCSLSLRGARVVVRARLDRATMAVGYRPISMSVLVSKPVAGLSQKLYSGTGKLNIHATPLNRARPTRGVFAGNGFAYMKAANGAQVRASVQFRFERR